MAKKKETIHYGVGRPIRWPMDNVDFACGNIYGKFSHYKPDVTCKNCRRTKIFRAKEQ